MSDFNSKLFIIKKSNKDISVSNEMSGDSKFAIANTEGVIIEKGSFDSEVSIPIEELEPGSYSLTLLNAETVECFSFTV